MERFEQTLKRIENKLKRYEDKLEKVLQSVPEMEPKRLPAKDVMKKYQISNHVLRRLRLGYKRSDGVNVPPELFKMGTSKE
jgi:hypothetical protein